MPSKTAIVVAGAAAHPEQLNAPELNDPLPPSYDQATGSYSPTKPGLPPTTLQKNPFPDAPVQLRQIQSKFPSYIILMQQRLNLSKFIVATYMVQSIVGPHSTQAICPSCRMSINTLITHDSSVRTHLFALLCCIL